MALLGAAMPGRPATTHRCPRRDARRPVRHVSRRPCRSWRSYAFPRPDPESLRATVGRMAASPAAIRPGTARRGPGVAAGHGAGALRTAGNGGGEFAARAERVLAGSNGRANPGSAAPQSPSDARQRRSLVRTGREVYRNICQACHQPNGRGQERVAPSLVGSALALGPAGDPDRILLTARKDKSGLMPSIGAVLNDDQIAGVLTYVRREWGQTGTPVDAATVKPVRDATAGRTKPLDR